MMDTTALIEIPPDSVRASITLFLRKLVLGSGDGNHPTEKSAKPGRP